MHSWANEASGLNWKRHEIFTNWKQIDSTDDTHTNIINISADETLVTKLRNHTVEQGDLEKYNTSFSQLEASPASFVLEYGNEFWTIDTNFTFDSSHSLTTPGLFTTLQNRVSDDKSTITQDERDRLIGVRSDSLTIDHFVRSNYTYFTPVGGLTTEQIRSRTSRFCKAHQSFLESAQTAKNPTAGQKYCMQVHEDDDCKELCSEYWNAASEASRPVTRDILEKLDNRLDVIDDSKLQMSDGEFLRMLQSRTQ